MAKKIEELTKDDVLGAQLGYCSDSRIMFRKTVQTRDYETEVVEASMRLDSIGDKPAPERLMILAMGEAQLEFAVYGGLYMKGLVTQEEFEDRVNKNLDYVKSLGKTYEGKLDLDSLL